MANTLPFPSALRINNFPLWRFTALRTTARPRPVPRALVVKKGETYLYDLATDIHEYHDIAAQHPDIVGQMIEIIYREHRPSELFKVTLP